MSIIQLTSLDWRGDERYSLVGHSFRVMAKANNFDEMVVGMMHALYAASSYTRGLFDCDVDGDPEWKTALDLFVPPLRLKKFRFRDKIPDEYLLNLNMPQGLSEKDRKVWLSGETRWSSSYAKWIDSLSRNRIARNVMIHKLEDMLDVLRHPGKYEDESGPQYYLLPWKKHYKVGIRRGSCIEGTNIPRTDDPLLLRELTDIERTNLIGKNSRALDMLQAVEDDYPVMHEYTEEDHRHHEEACRKWFLSWMEEERALEEYYSGGDDEWEEDEIPL